MAPLVSSVLMNVVPAQIAGVESIALASPPQKSFGGAVHPTILAACALLGVDEVWAVGGAQAVALLAYGGQDTDSAELEPVDMVTGPGNIYVTAAKRLCRSVVGIDSAPLIVAEAQRRTEEHLSIEYRVGDAIALDLPDGAFDRCRAERLLMHARHDPTAGVRELARVLRALDARLSEEDRLALRTTDLYEDQGLPP